MTSPGADKVKSNDKVYVKSIKDLEILEKLKVQIYNAIVNKEAIPKVGDLLKIIEMKNKLSVSGKGEKKFWDMINQIRKEELSKNKKQGPKSSVKKKKAPQNGSK